LEDLLIELREIIAASHTSVQDAFQPLFMYAFVDESHHCVGPYEETGGTRREPFENPLRSQHFRIETLPECSKANVEKTSDIFIYVIVDVGPGQ